MRNSNVFGILSMSALLIDHTQCKGVEDGSIGRRAQASFTDSGESIGPGVSSSAHLARIDGCIDGCRYANGGNQRTADRTAVVRHAAAGSDVISPSACAGTGVLYGGRLNLKAWRASLRGNVR